MSGESGISRLSKSRVEVSGFERYQVKCIGFRKVPHTSPSVSDSHDLITIPWRNVRRRFGMGGVHVLNVFKEWI